jgi:FtsH-binding integral membrane protein
MLFRNKFSNYTSRIGVGMLFLFLGSLALAASFILKRFSSQGGGTDFWQGLLLGASIVFLVTSAVFNLSGLIARRKQELENL